MGLFLCLWNNAVFGHEISPIIEKRIENEGKDHVSEIKENSKGKEDTTIAITHQFLEIKLPKELRLSFEVTYLWNR